MKRPKAKPDGISGSTDQDGAPLPEAREQKGDLLIRDLWQKVTDSVHDMRVVNTDAKTHTVKTPEKCLQMVERRKKRVYLEECLQQRRNFYPFVALVDGMMGVDATSTLKRFASRLATNWRQPYSRTCGFVKSRIAINLVRATHSCIRGSRMPAHPISVQHPQLDDGAGLNLFR